MSCSNCSQVIIPDELPPLAAADSGQVADSCEDNVASSSSSGCKLDSCLTDPRDLKDGEGMTILGRVGDILARFKGNGFIEIRNNLAFVVPSPPLRLRDLWVKWTSRGKAGDPLPFPFSTAVDANGVIHAIPGLENSDSLTVWDAASGTWNVVKVSDLAQQVNKTIPQSDHIEITGYEEVGMMDSSCGQDREMKALRGNGMVYLEKVPVNSCDDPCGSEAFAYVAKVAEFPTIVADETYKLQFSNSGLNWVQE